jgi:hypothetical protein
MKQEVDRRQVCHAEERSDEVLCGIERFGLDESAFS